MTRGRLVAIVASVLVAALLWWLWNPPEKAPQDPATNVVETAEPIVLVITPTVNDRFVQEPCSFVQGAGLFSFAALVNTTESMAPSVPVSLGDLTLAEGEPGRHSALSLLEQILPAAKLGAISAGEGELGFGSDFVRNALGRLAKESLLCANATDPAGRPLLRGWVLLQTGKRNVLVVSVAGESLREMLAARGSDVVITDPREAAARGLDEGLTSAEEVRRPVHTTLLLVHGTLDEATAIIQAAPGFDVAAAAHGPMLPETKPRRVGGVLLYYAGQGFRFAWRALVGGRSDGGDSDRLSRVGGDLMRQESPYREGLARLALSLKDEVYPRIVESGTERPADARGAYAHAAACKDCHAAQYGDHQRSAHARVSQALRGTAFAASTACVPCHVTAPYRVDGWMGPADESDFAAISCEACHGPAGSHVDVQDGTYGGVSFDVCYGCHLPDRSPTLDAEAFWEAWGHGGPPPPDEARVPGKDEPR